MKYSSIYSRRREPQRPVYRKVSWLDVLRAERRADASSKAAERVMLDAMLYGTGIGLTHVPFGSVVKLGDVVAKD